MSTWEPHARRQAALALLDQRLAAGEDDIDLLLDRADLLAALNRPQDAQAAYLALLNRRPDHRLALNHFGALVHRLGYTSAARTLYAQAVLHHPNDPMSAVNLANALVAAGEVQAAGEAFAAALNADPDYAAAHLGLARLAADRGEPEAAARHLRAAFIQRPVIEQPYQGVQAPVEVLLLISGLDADIPLQHVLDPAVFRVTALAPQFFGAEMALPVHHLVFNTIGDADLCPEALAAAERLVRRTDRPVINPPDRVALTGRVDNAARLAGLDGVVTAVSALRPRGDARRLDTEALAGMGLRFPLAVRAPGYHTGQHFERIDSLDDLGVVLEALPGDEAILMNFLDTAGSDGLYRKYRAMIVDGRLFPLHLAVSRTWKVHYFTADMEGAPDHRAEDAAFLADMPGAIGARAVAALGRIRDALGLDYGGMDFALSATGEVVLFEANATMVVYPPPPDPKWDYRRSPTEKVLQAVKTMILDRAGIARIEGGA